MEVNTEDTKGFHSVSHKSPSHYCTRSKWMQHMDEFGVWKYIHISLEKTNSMNSQVYNFFIIPVHINTLVSLCLKGLTSVHMKGWEAR